jgi:hypothetical protein
VVVYVGFDNGDDLGMKGADSAMPIWGDFMKEALRLNPEWNGDWAPPANVRRAEIDIRNGSLIRELDLNEKTDPAPAPASAEAPGDKVETVPPAEIFVTEVPAEFRRVEYFVAGTVPNRSLLPVTDMGVDRAAAIPEPSSTPISGTWQDSVDEGPRPDTASNSAGRSSPDRARQLTVMICPLTGMRATANCPKKEPRAYRYGEDPQEFCTFHH